MMLLPIILGISILVTAGRASSRQVTHVSDNHNSRWLVPHGTLTLPAKISCDYTVVGRADA